ncbi:glutathione S-transferase Mu 2 [Lingula anatina]|uniref:glutathione transferase n=1 Tax=Lingula anatina TaxID=7574 RepID=A0A1S3K712_LINAN|nr:glutathione S-transferase Mu 2 [Lingula anatina]|eukprot:XP_013418287.1 glutathione S-transferase Mu 2 [Lingula anatina]
MAPVLGYWDMRGLAHPIRMLLHYVGEEFEDRRHTPGPAPDFSLDPWLKIKFTLGVPFPNLPYWIDGDTKLAQSHAIIRHLARKHNLCPKSEAETIRCDVIDYQVNDFTWDLIYVCYNDFFKMGNYEQRRIEYLDKLPSKLKQYSDFLGDFPWFAGNNLTYVDFMAYEIFETHRAFAPGCLDGFQNLTDYMDRFEALPAIRKYMQSEEFTKKPYFNKFANWRGD